MAVRLAPAHSRHGLASSTSTVIRYLRAWCVSGSDWMYIEAVKWTSGSVPSSHRLKAGSIALAETIPNHASVK